MKLPIRFKKLNVKRFYGKDRNILILLVISLIVSIVLFLFGILSFLGINVFSSEVISGMDFIVFGLLSSIGPIGFYNHLKAKKKRDIEGHLPDFLREISSSTSSGMTVFDAIKSAAKGDHGRLTPELQKMASQLSWGISVKEALENFAKRINTPSPVDVTLRQIGHETLRTLCPGYTYDGLRRYPGPSFFHISAVINPSTNEPNNES